MFGAFVHTKDGYITDGCLNNFTGVAVSSLQPHGGPAFGGTLVTVLGHLFAVRGPSILCKFGQLDAVTATFLNDSAVQCMSPPSPGVSGFGFEDHFLEVTLNGDANFLTSSRVPYVFYHHAATLAVSSIYPRAGPKTGGTTITVYGSGFRVLGGSLGYRDCNSDVYATHALAHPLAPSKPLTQPFPRLPPLPPSPCSPPLSPASPCSPLQPPQSPSPMHPPGDGIGSGTSVCSMPLLEPDNRGLQCVFGGLSSVHAYLVRLTTPGSFVGTEIACQLPPLSDDDAFRLGAALPGSPMEVCVEVTLNGNRTQATQNCVSFTFYDS